MGANTKVQLALFHHQGCRVPSSSLTALTPLRPQLVLVMEVDADSVGTGAEETEYETELAPGGDVILSAPKANKGKPGRVLFRVDKIVLARHSEVFSGLFTVPYVPSSNEEYDGLPVVRLEDDGEVIGGLLHFLYNSSWVGFSPPQKQLT